VRLHGVLLKASGARDRGVRRAPGAVRVRERHVVDVGDDRSEAAPHRQADPRQAERAVRVAVVGAEERDRLRAAGRGARELERAVVGVGSRKAERDLLRAAAGRDPRQLGGEVGEALMERVAGVDGDQPLRLVADRGDDARVAVPGAGRARHRVEVEEAAAVALAQLGAVAAFEDQRDERDPRRRRQQLALAGEDLGRRAHATPAPASSRTVSAAARESAARNATASSSSGPGASAIARRR
jgi:hypothetical protein